MSLILYSTYEDLNPSTGTYTYFEPNQTPVDPNTITDLGITDSIDAATSSLQLGTDPVETQVIEMGSAEVTTTIYGAMTIVHAINASGLILANDLNVGGKTTLKNVSATELTSTYLDASTLKTTTLNATGTTTLGPLYAGNCSLMNVSAARVDLNTLTGVNCSMTNVSASRLEANTLLANNVSTTNFTVGNVLSTIPIPTGYTTVADPVGTQISLNTFTYATPNGVAAQTGGFYTYTSTDSGGLNIIQGKLNLTPVFAKTTYRVCFSVNYLNNPVDLSFQDDAGTLFTIGTLDPAPRKKYLFYVKPTVTGRLYLTITRAALSGAATIEYDFLSVDAWYETNLSTLNTTGSALLASGGGQVGVGTAKPQYTLDVSGTMRVTGEVYIGSSSTTFTTTGSNIKQVVPLLGGGQIENIVGNTTVASSMSTTFNRKINIATGSPVACYTITSSGQFNTQYFEILVSGANNNRGGYTYKGCFGLDHNAQNNIVPSSVSTLFYYGGGLSGTASPPVITITVAGFTSTLLVNSSADSSDQNFVTTLIAYPTLRLFNFTEDYIINAI